MVWHTHRLLRHVQLYSVCVVKLRTKGTKGLSLSIADSI